MKSTITAVAGLVSGLALGTVSLVGFGAAALAAPIGGGVCVPDRVYHNPPSYQVPECTCPNGAIKHRIGSNGDYTCHYPERPGHPTAKGGVVVQPHLDAGVAKLPASPK